MSLHRTTALVYLVLAVAFLFTYESPALDDDVPAWTYLGAAILIQPVTGFLIPRLWAFALPFVPLVVSLQSSEPVEPGMRITDAGSCSSAAEGR